MEKMENYKEASRLKSRFSTTKGSLSVEQLWDLSVTELDSLAVSLDEQYKNSKGKSFLDKKTTKDKALKLQFEIVIDILNTKVEEAEALRTAKENKAHNEKIYALIKLKEDGKLTEMSVEELESQLK
jgi:hypothetical protein